MGFCRSSRVSHLFTGGGGRGDEMVGVVGVSAEVAKEETNA